MYYFKDNLMLFLAICLLSACQTQKPEAPVDDAHLGEINLKVTGLEAAQSSFEEGMLLMHSFEYEDARTAFLTAQGKDPNMAMAFWGEAMTHNHALWQRQEKEDAVAALSKFGASPEERMEKVVTPLEKDLFQGAEILFGEGTKYKRDIAYRDHMAGLTEKYKGDNEVSALYAIALLGASRNGRDTELYGKSASIAKGIIKENPNHPGALHYLIHSYDDPEHAHLAKAAADSYSKVAPDAAHALHMPSHIYVALGLWDDVVTSNIASWNASVKRMERMGLEGDAKSYHAYRWLHYGLLQKGETQKAQELLEYMVDYINEKPTPQGTGYLIGMKGAQLVESGSWDTPLADISIDDTSLGIQSKVSNTYLDGLHAYNTMQLGKLTKSINTIKEHRTASASKLDPMGFPMCGAVGRPVTKLSVEIMRIKEMQLSAYHAALTNNDDLAAEWFEKASALDASLSYSYGPPEIFKPIDEAYADWLLAKGDYQKASIYYEKSLNRNPRRLLSLKGKKSAAEALDQEAIMVALDNEIQDCLKTQVRVEVL